MAVTFFFSFRYFCGFFTLVRCAVSPGLDQVPHMNSIADVIPKRFGNLGQVAAVIKRRDSSSW